MTTTYKEKFDKLNIAVYSIKNVEDYDEIPPFLFSSIEKHLSSKDTSKCNAVFKVKFINKMDNHLKKFHPN